MKIRVDRDVLNEAVSWTARSLSPRPPVPILSGILIKAEAGTLSLATFDYEVSARLEIEAEVESPGTILVSGKLLTEICRSLPSAPVEIETEGSKVTLTCRSSRFSLSTMPVEDYPELPELPATSGTVDGQLFAQTVLQEVVSASKDDTLPILTGVYIEIEDDTISMLSTDRYRLSLSEINWKPATSDISTSLLIKSKTLSEVAKTLGGAGDLNIALSPGRDLIGFESGGRRTTSLLVDGDYPKIRTLFPEVTPVHAVVDRAAVMEAVRRVSLVAERNTPVRMAFSDGQVILDAGTGEDAQASEGLEATLSGEDITVAFNPGYLAEGLAVMDAPFVRFSFTTAPKPAVLSTQNELDGESDDNFKYLLMPVRLPNQ